MARGRFVLNGGEVRFEVGAYDRRKLLIIDPVLVVNTSFGGRGFSYTPPLGSGGASDTGTGIGTDSSGNIYVTGTTFSTNFPLVNALQGTPCSYCMFSEIFVTKLSPDGQTLLYSTYLGAATYGVFFLPGSIAVDSGGTVYLTGTTSGVNFPGATKTEGGNDAFLSWLGAQGETQIALVPLTDSRALVGTCDGGGSPVRESPPVVVK
jgi:hypothetical protein